MTIEMMRNDVLIRPGDGGSSLKPLDSDAYHHQTRDPTTASNSSVSPDTIRSIYLAFLQQQLALHDRNGEDGVFEDDDDDDSSLGSVEAALLADADEALMLSSYNMDDDDGEKSSLNGDDEDDYDDIPVYDNDSILLRRRQNERMRAISRSSSSIPDTPIEIIDMVLNIANADDLQTVIGNGNDGAEGTATATTIATFENTPTSSDEDDDTSNKNSNQKDDHAIRIRHYVDEIVIPIKVDS